MPPGTAALTPALLFYATGTCSCFFAAGAADALAFCEVFAPWYSSHGARFTSDATGAAEAFFLELYATGVFYTERMRGLAFQ